MRFSASQFVAGAIIGALLTAGAIHFNPRMAEFYSEPVSINTAYGCVETTITEVRPPTDASSAGDGDIVFANDIAPGHGAKNSSIMAVTLYGFESTLPPAGISLGDHVRVCLSAVPEKSVDKTGMGCDPERDSRGRQFIVYDRASGSIGQYTNGEHMCGGA